MVKQLLQDTFEGLKGQVKDVADTGKRESMNIVKEIFSAAKGSDEKGSSGSLPQQVQDQQQLARVRQQQQYLVKQAARLRQLEEKKETGELNQAEEERLSERNQVMQLRKAEEKKETLQQKNIRSLQGTRESGPRKRF